LLKLPQRVMAFGAGVLISALSFDLMDEAYRQGGTVSIPELDPGLCLSLVKPHPEEQP